MMITFLVAVSVTACSSSVQRQGADEKIAENTVNLAEDYKVGDRLPNELVCMVNDAYMGKPQIPVQVNGKTYYGCCQMCVTKLNEEENARMATDPSSGQVVDKTEAYIVLLNNKGDVAYFDSEASYNANIKKE